MMRAMNLLPLLLCLAFASPAHAQGTTPPVVDESDRLAADRVASMPDADPVSRMLMLLEARKLDDGGLFALAATHPDIVEQAVVARYKRAVSWLESIPAPEMYRVRRGEQILRSRDLWRGNEEELAIALGNAFGFKEKKLLAVRSGPYEGRVFRIIVDSKGHGDDVERGTIELAWPPTPERDEASRDTLTKYFGARPSRRSAGSGSLLPLLDASFEDPGTLGVNWTLEDAVVLGVRTPVSDINIDTSVHLDGQASVRAYNSSDTRLFQAIVQRVEVAPGMRLSARVHHKTENVRAEFQQNEGDLYLSMTFEDIFQHPVAAPIIDRGRISTHTWEPLEVSGTVPDEAAYVRIGLVSGLSGTTWFDGASLTLD